MPGYKHAELGNCECRLSQLLLEKKQLQDALATANDPVVQDALRVAIDRVDSDICRDEERIAELKAEIPSKPGE